MKKLKMYKLLSLVLGLILSFIVLGVGVYAIVSKQLSFNVGFRFIPEVLCKVEVGYDNIFGNGANDIIDDSEYATIFDNNTGVVNVDYITYLNSDSLRFDAVAIGLGKTFNLRITNYTSSHSILAWIQSDLFTGTPVDSHTGLFYAPKIVLTGAAESKTFANISLASVPSKNSTIKLSMKKIVQVENDLSHTSVSINSANSTLQTDYNKYNYIDAGTDYSATYTPDAGYSAPEKLKVFIKNTLGNLTLLGQENYSYAVTNNIGQLLVPADVVNGFENNVKIVVVSAKVFKVSDSFIGVTVSYDQTAFTSGYYFPDMGNLQATITATANYALPDAIEIECNGTKLTPGTHFTYIKQADSANLVIQASAVTEDLRIYIWGVSQSYTVFSYAANTGPIYDNNNNSANRYVHYVEMGEYPQRYAGTTSTIAATLQGTYYVDNSDGSKKYALSGSNYYLVEPVKWIVMGVTDGVLNGTSVLFTTNNKTANLWQYNSGTNTFQYRTNAGNAWTAATEVLVLSEYGLMRGQFHPSTNNNRFSQCQINTTLNTTLYNSLFTANQKTKITPKKMAITTRGEALNSGEDAGVAYNLFLLGANWNYNGSSWGLYSTDSYNVSTYFTPANKDWAGQGNLIAKETSYSAGSTANSPNGYGAYGWWLRSGTYSYTSHAMIVHTDGFVDGYHVNYSLALRPAFVLNLA